MNQQAFLKSINPLIPGGDNLEQTVVFYEQKLGFKPIHQEGAPIYMAIVKRDSVQLFLLKNGDKHLAEGTSFRINVNQIEQLYAEFEAKDQTSCISPINPGWVKSKVKSQKSKVIDFDF